MSGQVYYNIHPVTHSEVDDASAHVWQCQDITYDQGVAAGLPPVVAGWPTTTSSYSNCANHAAGATLTSYVGYNGNGQVLAGVDARGVSTPSLYSSAGCTVTTAPTYVNSAWTGGHYSSCMSYDGQSGLPTTQKNAFSQATTTSYDGNQGQVPISTVDVNTQTSSLAYSYDASGNKTVQAKAPGEAGSYTNQSQIISTCTDSSVLPCMHQDSNSVQYSSAISRTFYDQVGRAVETQTPSADGSHTIVSFTLYNDRLHTVLSSQPFTLTSQTAWVDPNNYTSTPGTLVTLDALGRTVSALDAAGKTTSSVYGLGTASGDSSTYATSTGTDANGHVAVSFTDALGRTRYTQTDSGKAGGTLTPVKQTATQYNVLNLPTSITVKDLVPQSGQTITSVTTTAQYDDQGRETSIADPDRGTHTYTYDADGAMISDVSGTRTVGYSVDLLGRVGCVQDATPTADVHGACSSGANPFVKNTYDADPGGVTWTGSNYPVGELTQSVAITYLPSPDNAQGTVTQNWQHDQRGRLITSRLNMAVTGGTLPFPTFPQYQQTQSYNDADQPMMMQTSVGGSGGYTTSQAYDGTTGTLTGVSNNSVGTANLATLSYNGQGLIGGMSYLSTSGSPVATSTMSYDPVLRPTGTTTTWQSNGTTLFNDQVSYDAVGNVLSRTATEAAVSGQSGTGGSETQNFCYDEQNRLIWASNNATVPSAGNGTCGNVQYQSTLGGNYTNQYVYTNLGQLWKGPMNGGSTQEQYLYCDSAHPHQLSNLSQTASTPTCASKGTVDYTGTYDSWGNTASQVRGGITRTLKYDGLDHLVRWSSSVNSQQEWNLYDASGERVLRRTYDGTNTVLTVFAFGVEEHAYSYSGSGSSDTNISNTYYYDLAGHTLGTWDGTSPGSPTTNFLLTDTLGSVVSSFNNLPNGAAVVLGDQVYGPYGNRRVQQGTIGTSKGFTGQFTDFVAGLDYYGARYYDPVVGVFVSADVVQGNAQGMNPYGYVGGNPETWIDPTGHQIIEGGEGGGGGDVGGDVGGGGLGGGGNSGGLVDVTTPEGTEVLEPGQTPPVVGTQGNVTAQYNPDEGTVTTMTKEADGSTSWTTLNPGDPGYEEALNIADGGGGPSADEVSETSGLPGTTSASSASSEPTTAPVSPPAATSEPASPPAATSEPTSPPTGNSESSTDPGGNITPNSNTGSSQLEMTNTVINNNKVVSRSIDPNIAQVGMSTERMSRPYVQSPATQWLVENIMANGEPQADKWLANGWRWDVQGFMNQSAGRWELVVDQDANRIVHFLFSRDKTP